MKNLDPDGYEHTTNAGTEDLVAKAAAIPTGGTTGQVLSKADGNDYSTVWTDTANVGYQGALMWGSSYEPGTVVQYDRELYQATAQAPAIWPAVQITKVFAAGTNQSSPWLYPGDLLLILVYTDAGATWNATPAGFTVTDDVSTPGTRLARTYWKIAGPPSDATAPWSADSNQTWDLATGNETKMFIVIQGGAFDTTTLDTYDSMPVTPVSTPVLQPTTSDGIVLHAILKGGGIFERSGTTDLPGAIKLHGGPGDSGTLFYADYDTDDPIGPLSFDADATTEYWGAIWSVSITELNPAGAPAVLDPSFWKQISPTDAGMRTETITESLDNTAPFTPTQFTANTVMTPSAGKLQLVQSGASDDWFARYDGFVGEHSAVEVEVQFTDVDFGTYGGIQVRTDTGNHYDDYTGMVIMFYGDGATSWGEMWTDADYYDSDYNDSVYLQLTTNNWYKVRWELNGSGATITWWHDGGSHTYNHSDNGTGTSQLFCGLWTDGSVNFRNFKVDGKLVAPTIPDQSAAAGLFLSTDGTDITWAAGGGASDHGALTGLADDDHTQYHTDARGDARYYTQAQVDSSLSGKSDTAHTHTESDVTDLGSYPDATAQPVTKVPQTDGAGGWTFIDTPAAGGSAFIDDYQGTWLAQAYATGELVTNDGSVYLAEAPVAGASASYIGSAIGNATVVVPAGVQAGDLIVVMVKGGQTSTASTPAGYTLATDSYQVSTWVRSWLYYKTADGSESGTTFDAAGSGLVKSMCYVVRNATFDTYTKFIASSHPDNTVVNVPAITPATANGMYLHLVQVSAGDTAAGDTSTLPGAVQDQASGGNAGWHADYTTADPVGPVGYQETTWYATRHVAVYLVSLTALGTFNAGSWTAVAQGVPAGGTTGQVLSKIDGNDYNADWADAAAIYSPGTWTALPLSNSWVSYSDGSDGQPTAEYRKDTNGWVEVKGVVKDGTTTVDTVIGTLPVGFRPPTNRHVAVTCAAGTYGFGMVLVNTSGEILAKVANSTWTSLTGIRFNIDA